MTENTEIVQADTEDLNAFETLMFGQTKHEEETPVAAEEEVEENTEPVNEEVEADDALPENDEGSDEDEEDSEPTPEEKPKKNRFQERIDKLVNERREADERADQLLAKLEETLAKLNGKEEEKTEAPKPAVTTQGPTPDDADENGEPKYPLGEFDPLYIRDLTRYTIRTEAELNKQEEANRAAAEQKNIQQAQLVQEWSEKVTDAIDTKYPDFREKVTTLEESFTDLDPQYGELLVTEIMSMDFGTDVLYHLAANPDEAKKIVAAGPARALRMLGTVEARYSLFQEEKEEKKLKVSNAPTPPERLNKGTSVSKEIAPDTDDLDAFEKLMFKRKR